VGSFARTFDGLLPEIGDLAGLEDAALVDAAAGWARTENAECARKTAVMAELFARRTGLPAGERELWWVDPEAAVGVELAAAQGISRWMALAQAHRGVVLADRLPKVAALFETGISEVVLRTIESRSALVTDDEAIERLDALLAGHVTVWGPLSVTKTEQAIDAIVDRVDPGALRRSRKTSCQRDVEFGSPSDEAGFTSMWARLYAPGCGGGRACWAVIRLVPRAERRAFGTAGVRHWWRCATRTALHSVAGAGRFCALPRLDVSVAGLRHSCLRLLYRPHRALPDRAHASLE
jgi:hypothetical protein